MTDKLSPEQFASLAHWSSFGRRGQAAAHRVVAADVQYIPMLKPVTSTWNTTVPRTEFGKLLNGFSPESMDDKWVVYTEGPNNEGNVAVHMVRSWTGFKLVEVKIKMQVDGEGKLAEVDPRIEEIVWEASEERYGDQSTEWAIPLAREVCRWVLDVRIP